jgi:hypothetical protein
MASNYPSGFDTFPLPTSSDKTESVAKNHSALHRKVNEAIEAVQGTLGTNPQSSYNTVAERLSAIETGAITIDAEDLNIVVTAQDVDITDSGNYFTSTEVESALQEIADGSMVNRGGSHSITTIAATGATETLNTSQSPVFDVTMDQNCTFTFSNITATGTFHEWIVILRGSFTPTWPAAVKWSGGSAPTHTTLSVYTFFSVNGGSYIFGHQAGTNYS